MCQECDQCRENQLCLAMYHNSMVRAEIHRNQHLVTVDYKSVCIFECQLSNLQSNIVVESLKSVYDVRAPDKLITDNVRNSKISWWAGTLFMWHQALGIHKGIVMLKKQYIWWNSSIRNVMMSKWGYFYWRPHPWPELTTKLHVMYFQMSTKGKPVINMRTSYDIKV